MCRRENARPIWGEDEARDVIHKLLLLVETLRRYHHALVLNVGGSIILAHKRQLYVHACTLLLIARHLVSIDFASFFPLPQPLTQHPTQTKCHHASTLPSNQPFSRSITTRFKAQPQVSANNTPTQQIQ